MLPRLYALQNEPLPLSFLSDNFGRVNMSRNS
jgi:hypothetical protein